MALSGVRDISTINSPPEERLPVVTHIGPYSPKLVREAIVRELDRGGQVFFVHNRVQSIAAVYNHLQNLVPEARIGIGHGQLPENELADVMHQFTSGQIDVLLSTSIIESGLDIPNANTLIVDRADTLVWLNSTSCADGLGGEPNEPMPTSSRTNAARPPRKVKSVWKSWQITLLWVPAIRLPCATWKCVGLATCLARVNPATSLL